MSRAVPVEAAGRVLVVTAHPDDVDFGAAGTIDSIVRHGGSVVYCIITDGDAGGFDPDVPRSQMPGIRRAEQVAAAGKLGVTDVRFLGYKDGRLTVSMDLRRDISRVIRQVKPDLVITQSPRRNFQRIHASHPDHLATGEATLCAVYPDARNEFAHPELVQEGLDAFAVPQVWLMADPEPDHFVDVTDSFDTKVAALLCHESQMTPIDDLDRVLRKWMGSTALSAGMAPERLAESFTVVETV